MDDATTWKNGSVSGCDTVSSDSKVDTFVNGDSGKTEQEDVTKTTCAI